MSLLTRLGVRVAGTLIGRRPGINFTGTNGVAVTGADNPSNGRVDLTVDGAALQPVSAKAAANGYASLDSSGQVPLGQLGNVPGGGASSFPVDGSFLNSVSVGATSFTLSAAAAGGLNGARAALLLIDDGLGSVEIIRATISGSSGTLSTPSGGGAANIGPNGFLKAHSAGAKIRWLRDNKIEPAMVNGGLGESMALQAALIYCYRWAATLDTRYSAYGTNVSLFAGTLDVGDGGLTIVGTSPWSHTPYLDPNRSLTNPFFDHSTYTLRSAREIDYFTATASNDRFTTATPQGGHGITIGAAISFSAPLGETMPGGITPGMTYYVKDFPTGTTFRLSTLPNLSDTVDVTSDGAGWLYTNWDSLLRFYVWGRLYVITQAVDVCGVHLCVQQDNSITSLRTRMDANATSPDRAISLWITGQISNFGDMETDINGANCVGSVVTANFFNFKGKWWIQHGGNVAATSMIIAGFGHKFAGGEIESLYTGGTGIRIVHQLTDTDFGDWISSSTQDATIPIFDDHTGDNGSYRVGQAEGQNTIVWDAVNGRDLLGGLGTISHGFRKLWNGRGVEILGRYTTRVGSSTTVKLDTYCYLVDAQGADVVLTLPKGVAGPSVTARKILGTHNVIFRPFSGDNIEGSASDYIIPTGATRLVWEAVSNSWWIA